MNGIFLESGYVSLNKTGEQLCGDCVVSAKNEDCQIMVLSDGLGSGVKANILATLTAKMLCTMIEGNLTTQDCVETIASILPVCSVRELAYSTFSVVKIDKTGTAQITQFDNPDVILLRGGVSFPYEKSHKIICGKNIYESKLKIKTGDIFILMSDGVIYAGVGKTLNFGWGHKNVVSFAQNSYDETISAKTMAKLIGEECKELYRGEPGDDTTIAVVRVRKRQTVNLMIGPPQNKEDDKRYLEQFFAKQGKKIVCGGTTSSLVAQYLNTPLLPSLEYIDPVVPPIATIKGVDLVTEGVITMGKVLKISRKYIKKEDFEVSFKEKKDGASLIARMLLEEATDINFFAGKAVNPAHQNPNLPEDININVKITLVNALAALLTSVGKNVKINFY